MMKKNQISAEKIFEGYQKLEIPAKDFFEEDDETEEYEKLKEEGIIFFHRKVEDFCITWGNKKLYKKEKKVLETLFILYYSYKHKLFDNKIVSILDRVISRQSSKIVSQFCEEHGISDDYCYFTGLFISDYYKTLKILKKSMATTRIFKESMRGLLQETK